MHVICTIAELVELFGVPKPDSTGHPNLKLNFGCRANCIVQE